MVNNERYTMIPAVMTLTTHINLTSVTPWTFSSFLATKQKEAHYITHIRKLLVLIEEEFTEARLMLTEGTCNSDASDSLQLIIEELQCHDILSQRIHHLLDGFNHVKALFVDKKFKYSFLDLQFFQLIAIGHDLEKTITTIRTLASSIITSEFNGPKESDSLFARYNDIKHSIEVSNRSSMSCVVQRILTGTPPLTSTQAATCLAAYTMESERIVLQWFQTNMPFGKYDDLLQAYEAEMQKINNESIELF